MEKQKKTTTKELAEELSLFIPFVMEMHANFAALFYDYCETVAKIENKAPNEVMQRLHALAKQIEQAMETTYEANKKLLKQGQG